MASNNGDEDAWNYLVSWADALQSTVEGTEEEESPYLSSEELSLLAKHPHALDHTFSKEDLEFLDQNGYLVVKGLIPRGVCDTMVSELFERIQLLARVQKDDYR